MNSQPTIDGSETAGRFVRPEGDETSGPAIGMVATEDNAEAIARETLRARNRGHSVFVAHLGDPEIEAVQFAEQLDATVVHSRDGAGPEAVLSTAANARGAEGLVYHEQPDHRLDYEATLADRDEDEYLVEAVTGRETSTGDVVAAIPAYNEADTIEEVVQGVRTYVDDVIVVDDGSEDDTAKRARHTGAIVVEHEKNRGYGAALSTGFREARDRDVDHLVILDGDGQHDPEDVASLLDRQEETGAEIVIGSRFIGENRSSIPLYRRFGLGVINAVTNLSMGVVRRKARVGDTQSGMRAYDRTAIEALADADIGDHMDASTDILYHGHHAGFDFEEVGIDVDYTVDDANNHHPLVHGWVLLRNLLRTIERDRPGTVLGIPGFVIAFVGVGFGYWTISNYLSTDVFPMGLAVTSVFFVLVGVFTCFTGIILHSLNTHFEGK